MTIQCFLTKNLSALNIITFILDGLGADTSKLDWDLTLFHIFPFTSFLLQIWSCLEVESSKVVNIKLVFQGLKGFYRGTFST